MSTFIRLDVYNSDGPWEDLAVHVILERQLHAIMSPHMGFKSCRGVGGAMNEQS